MLSKAEDIYHRGPLQKKFGTLYSRCKYNKNAPLSLNSNLKAINKVQKVGEVTFNTAILRKVFGGGADRNRTKGKRTD